MGAETTRKYERSYGTAIPVGENAQTQILGADDGGTQPTRMLAPSGDSLPITEERPHEPLRAGTRVGRYLILGHVGAGGLGDVYGAFDSELDRKVAIKILRPTAYDKSLGDPTQRLLREAQALAKLRHPNVVTVFDVGTFEDEVFVAMEFVAGRTLTRWLNEARPDWRAIRDTYLLAGTGLAAAHEAGLVHRDFKLDNVIVDDDGHVTVLDFGLARAIGRIDPQDADSLPIPINDPVAMHTPVKSLLDHDVTRASLVLGTPPYMSPELLVGEPATAMTDQFAFCVALFKGLYRKLPYKATTLAEHYNAARNGRIEKVDDAHVPGWLRRVVERGLQADPRRRWPSMHALLDALLADRRRRRRYLMSVMIAVPLLSVGVATVAVATRPEPTQQERALTQQLAEEARAAAANGYYVFPPSDAPDTPTALSKVAELESLDGAAGEEGRRVGHELRTELAQALARLGDRYFDRPGGPAFASDFYAAALVFDPDHERARERVMWTQGQLAELARRAEAGDFTPAELEAAEALAVLAIEEPEARAERVREYFGEGEATSTTTPSMLESVLDEDERAVARAAKRARAKRRRERVEARADAEPPPEEPVAVADAPHEHDLVDPFADEPPTTPDEQVPLETTPGAKNTTPPAPDTPDEVPYEDSPERRKQSKADARAGEEALRRGDLTRAEELFHRALRGNRKNIKALTGLSEVHFQGSNYEKALAFAKKAVAAAPRSHRAHLYLGNAYQKLLQYDAARKAYKKAVELGSAQAKTRLEKLDERLGG